MQNIDLFWFMWYWEMKGGVVKQKSRVSVILDKFEFWLADHWASSPAWCDQATDQGQSQHSKELCVVVPDEVLLWSEELWGSTAAVYPDGQLQVQLRLWVPGCAGQTGANPSHRQVLPDHDTGSRGTPRWIPIWWVNTLSIPWLSNPFFHKSYFFAVLVVKNFDLAHNF